MLEAYVAAGFTPSEFWLLSPRLYLSHMRGAQARITADQQARDALAWKTAALMRQDRLPSFHSFIGVRPAYQPDDPDELQRKLDILARAWGAKEAA